MSVAKLMLYSRTTSSISILSCMYIPNNLITSNDGAFYFPTFSLWPFRVCEAKTNIQNAMVQQLCDTFARWTIDSPVRRTLWLLIYIYRKILSTIFRWWMQWIICHGEVELGKNWNHFYIRSAGGLLVSLNLINGCPSFLLFKTNFRNLKSRKKQHRFAPTIFE